jgi:sulfate transport system permease protein
VTDRSVAAPEIRPGSVATERAVDADASTGSGEGSRGTGRRAQRERRAGEGRAGRWIMRIIALTYLAFLLVIPVGLVFYRTFENGIGPVWKALTTDGALHAFQVTFIVAGCAVVLNTIFGMVASFLLVRHDFRGKGVINKLIDLPLAVSPVVVGLSLILVYGRETTIGSFFGDQGVDIIFALPGMVMATAFVSLPLMVREVVPILEEIGTDQEQAAATLGATPFQTFRRVTLPAIKWGVAYGIILTLARCLGEFGAVAVVSGRVVGQTQTATLYVEQSFENFKQADAYAVAFALAALAILALLIMNLFRPKEP